MENNNEEREQKPEYKTLVKDENAIYEMVYDRENYETYFIGFDRVKNKIIQTDEIYLHDRQQLPLPPNNNLINVGVILFPSHAEPYESEEELLKSIQQFIHKYVCVSEVFEQIATYYVLFTWLFDRFNEVPYLRALGDFGSGKSRFLQTIGSICYKPIFTGGATTASPIFRMLNEFKGTLVLDEADYRFSDMTSEIVKILNTGYQKGMPVLRSEGKGIFEVKAYDVFSPKIIATRETFTDKALESRFLVEEMGTGKLRADISRTLDESFYAEALQIRNKLLMWRLKNYFEPIELNKDLIENIHPRLNQIVIPLLSIIKDEAIKDGLKAFIIKYNGEMIDDRGFSLESDIVFVILKLEHETGAKEVTVKQIADKINRELDPGDEKLTPKKVGTFYLRKKLQLKPHKTRKGFALSLKENKSKLDMWRERFGITEEDISGDKSSENSY